MNRLSAPNPPPPLGEGRGEGASAPLALIPSPAGRGRRAVARAEDAHFVIRGFTLIELVVVLLIITIILGMVGVQLTRDESDIVREEAQRLALVLQNAQQQAILEGRPYAFALTDAGYRFMRLGDKNRLVPIEADEILAPRRLPRAITLVPGKLPDQAKTRADLILFDPSGEFPAFTMIFEVGEIAWYVQGQADGQIRSTPTLEPAPT